MEIKRIELNQMKVASFQFVGENPELNAIKSLLRWVQGKNVFSKDMKLHFFGFNNPIPSEGGTLHSMGQITAMYDKGEGRGALIIGDVDTTHSNGQKLFTNTVTIFSRFDGGFEGERGPREDFIFPDRTPEINTRMHPSPDQPLIFRLSGDMFPLHVDPDFAKASGFERPIMAGLCTLGFTLRALIKGLFPGEPERLTRIKNRFTNPLYPGNPIEVQIWKVDNNKALFKTLDVDKSIVVIDRGIVEWK